MNTWVHPDWSGPPVNEMDAFYCKWGMHIHTNYVRHRIIADMAEGPSVMDFGCGTGDLLLILQEEHPDWHLVGVEISEVARDMARIRGLEAELHEQIPAGRFDTIVASQVLEHLEDDAGLLDELGEHLVPGGLLIVTVPKEDRLPDENHLREYTAASLAELVGRVGPVTVAQDVGSYRMLAAARKEDRWHTSH